MPTLLQYRQYIARELGPFLASTADTTSSTSVLIDLAWPVKSSLSSDDFYVDYYILRPAAASATDRVRLVKTYTPSTGSLTPDTVWTNAPVAGEAYELHGVMDPGTTMLDIINAALKRTLIRTELVGTCVADVSRHSLSTIAPWLTDPLWVRQVGWLSASDNRNQTNPYWRTLRGQAIEDDSTGAAGVAIEHPGYSFNASLGGVLEAELAGPGDRESGPTGAESPGRGGAV